MRAIKLEGLTRSTYYGERIFTLAAIGGSNFRAYIYTLAAFKGLNTEHKYRKTFYIINTW